MVSERGEISLSLNVFTGQNYFYNNSSKESFQVKNNT